MAFEFKTCSLSDGTQIKGLYEIQPKIFGDSRGHFLETYSAVVSSFVKKYVILLTEVIREVHKAHGPFGNIRLKKFVRPVE